MNGRPDFVDTLVAILLLFAALISMLLPVLQFYWWAIRRFRLHLSTVSLSMLVAAIFIAINACPNDYGYRDLHHIETWSSADFRGWPFNVLTPDHWDRYFGPDDPKYDFYLGMFFNLMIALNLISLFALGLEYSIDRKSRRT